MSTKKQMYFISGLPRSGSTLLSSILNQNPDFHAGVTSDLLPLLRNTIQHISLNQNSVVLNKDRRKDILVSMCEGYYKAFNKKIIFDTNRTWTNNIPLITDMFPNTKIIACVRDINEILNSFELLYASNPYHIKNNLNMRMRVAHLMDDRDENSGGVIFPWVFLKDAWEINPEIFHFIEYNDLVKKPNETMSKLYDALNLPQFKHDFENVEYSIEEYDSVVGQPNLHKVRKSVTYRPVKWVISEEIRNRYHNLEFWR